VTAEDTKPPQSAQEAPEGPNAQTGGEGAEGQGKSATAIAERPMESSVSESSGRGEGQRTHRTDSHAQEPPKKRRKPPAPADWKERFIASLEEYPVVATALTRAQVSKTHAYDTKAADPEFAEAWRLALETGADKIEQTALEVAHEGDVVMTCTYHENGALATCKVQQFRSRGFQDRQMMLKAIRPERFRERYEVKQTTGDVDREIQELFDAFKAGGGVGPPKGGPEKAGSG